MRKNLKNNAEHRSSCPINLTLEVIGDKWSLIIIRDMIFGNRRHFRELLNQSEEGIASNILSDRLKVLVEQGLVTKAEDASHKQKVVYSLTEKAIQLVPVIAHIGDWGTRFLDVSPELSIRAKILFSGGQPLWEEFMNELRHLHLGEAAPRESVFLQLQEAYRQTLEEQSRSGSLPCA